MQPFLLHGVPLATVEAGSSYLYKPSTSGSNGRVLSYEIVNKPEWATFTESTGELSGTPEDSNVGVSGEIEIDVSDGTTHATVGPFRVRVIPQEQRSGAVLPTTPTTSTAAPTITGTPASTITAGQPFSFTPVVADPSGAALSFSIVNRPSWATFNTATGALSGTPTNANAGTFTNIVVSVSAGAMPISLPAFTVQVQATVDNTPTISGTPVTKVSAGGNYAFTPAAGDPEGSALTFSILNAPSWTSFNSKTGELSGTAPASVTASLFSNIVISVSDGTLSASLAPFSISVQPTATGTPVGPSGGNSIKFHPGNYIELDPGSGGGGLTGWLATIASLRGAANVKGVVLWQSWSQLEFAENVYTSGSGANAGGFAAIDQLLSACKSAGLQFILAYEDRSFGGSFTSSSPTSEGTLPPYFDTLENGSPGYIDAAYGSSFQGEGMTVIADYTNPVVAAREFALVTAYGARYDSNPNFEMFRTPETANASFTSSGQFDQEVAYLQSWMAAARAAFPTTGLSISANFLDTPAQLTTLFDTAVKYGVGMGGPDVTQNLPGSPAFSGTSNIVFNGYEGGKDYRGILPWIAEIQTPDENGQQTEAQAYTEATTGTPGSGGSMKPSYMFWSLDASGWQPNGWTNSSIMSYVAGDPTLNMTSPSSYPQ